MKIIAAVVLGFILPGGISLATPVGRAPRSLLNGKAGIENIDIIHIEVFTSTYSFIVWGQGECRGSAKFVQSSQAPGPIQSNGAQNQDKEEEGIPGYGATLTSEAPVHFGRDDTAPPSGAIWSNSAHYKIFGREEGIHETVADGALLSGGAHQEKYEEREATF
ncbi:hypothetical protein WOLCODRAFT_18857 [Wolfiporia cocos MD-104 SS10]|uniref:Uncharacterized protein n=1 Tax=Wolfiporia cocos (strain MD-104) TaxID=742152 RepID=A0A2H3JQ88_WOLCO|nr:hypothetical protein WOLCODRAFT_18857 [Wolfiporia cocos MD-104 SS10]